jgi:hypothetical protein
VCGEANGFKLLQLANVCVGDVRSGTFIGHSFTSAAHIWAAHPLTRAVRIPLTSS